MKQKKILVVVSKYYDDISNNLFKSAKIFLEGKSLNFDVLEVPGALEIPQAVNLKINSINNSFFYEGYIALGCVIKGETYHFEIVSNEANRGLMNIALKYKIPIGNGIITAYNHEQAIERSFDKGNEAASDCYELLKLKN